MKKHIYTAIVSVCSVLLLLSACIQIIPASASAQVTAQVSLASASIAPPSETQQASASPSVSETTPAPSASSIATASPTATQTPMPSQSAAKYKVAVPYDLQQEKNSQKSVDAGHSPWRLDPAFVAQVFVSLQISPGGIVGDYPIPYEDFKVTQMNDTDTIVEVNSDKSPTARVYLKQLVQKGDGGIWTVVGYDPK